MTDFITESLSWINPLGAFTALAKAQESFAFFYSGQQLEETGQYSYLALYPLETVSGDNFDILKKVQAPGKMWFGYLGYELLHNIENIPRESNSYIALPDMCFVRFGLVLTFDHANKTVTAKRHTSIPLPQWKEEKLPSTPIQVESITSPMTRKQYIDIVSKTKDAITAGDFYQANITRKFTGSFAKQPDIFSLFGRLSEASPAGYSAFIKCKDTVIISSSPECFLKIDSEGNMESLPIKGTAPRFADTKKDTESRQSLQTSEKDRAENMMIVDLMRNDFSHSAEKGSVKVEKLFEVSSYATLHHMASKIAGKKRKDVSTIDAIKDCFPPGSMTGAPKVHAIKWCNKHEKIRRGVYSGALGWIDGNGACDLSVVIRTLIIQNNQFEFQVGGGIVADSEPEKEWQETMTKARGIMNALALDLGVIESL